MRAFDINNSRLREQFDRVDWIETSGISDGELSAIVEEMTRRTDAPKAILKAKTFALIAEHGRIGLTEGDIFQEKLSAGEISFSKNGTWINWSNLMVKQRGVWHNEIIKNALSDETDAINEARAVGAYGSAADFGHTSPNSKALLAHGFKGLLLRLETAAKSDGLTEKQKTFYDSCRITLEACITVAKRLSDAVKPRDPECAEALSQLTVGAPRTTYEAMQLIILYFFLHEYIMGTRIRTLGRLDVMLRPFYERDLAEGTYTRAELAEMMKFFLNKLSAMKVPFGLPFCIGGIDEDGEDVTSEISYLIVRTYTELDIYSPKIHVRYSEKSPKDFIKLILDSIRHGSSSFVFTNDAVTVKALTNVGIDPRDAHGYVPIGCYEPAVWGMEIGCTGNGGVNLAKAIEFIITGGKDLRSGKAITFAPGRIDSFEDFVREVKSQISFMMQNAINYVTKIERFYGDIGPDPLLSSMYDESVRRGIDVFEGGAKYNNSSMYFYCIASLIDSMCAIKKLVFDDRRLTLPELSDILKNNWRGHEDLRREAMRLPEKYGNLNPTADALTCEMTDFCAGLINNKPNGRGGVFKASCFSIDRFITLGKLTMATPDSRFAGDPLSKNLCASIGMDKKGITALIGSVTKIDHSKLPNGSVLDVVLHPSAVKGDDGLEAFYAILATYMKKGGFAMHGNVFDTETLEAAKRDPESYKNLQVRLCGWNVYFVNLSEDEQDAFIRQTKELS